MKKYRSESDWRELIAEQERSGESVARFCRERGIHPNLFYRKAGTLKRSGRFIMVSGGMRNGPVIEIRTGRVTISVPGGFRGEELVRVLRCVSEAEDA